MYAQSNLLLAVRLTFRHRHRLPTLLIAWLPWNCLLLRWWSVSHYDYFWYTFVRTATIFTGYPISSLFLLSKIMKTTASIRLEFVSHVSLFAGGYRNTRAERIAVKCNMQQLLTSKDRGAITRSSSGEIINISDILGNILSGVGSGSFSDRFRLLLLSRYIFGVLRTSFRIATSPRVSRVLYRMIVKCNKNLFVTYLRQVFT